MVPVPIRARRSSSLTADPLRVAILAAQQAVRTSRTTDWRDHTRGRRLRRLSATIRPVPDRHVRFRSWTMNERTIVVDVTGYVWLACIREGADAPHS